MKPFITIKWTYDITTPESAENGEHAESGWAYASGGSLQIIGGGRYLKRFAYIADDVEEAVDVLRDYLGCFDDGGNSGKNFSLYGVDPDLDYEDASETRFAAHVECRDDETANALREALYRPKPKREPEPVPFNPIKENLDNAVKTQNVICLFTRKLVA